MHAETATIHRMTDTVYPWFLPGTPLEPQLRHPGGPSLYREQAWRQAAHEDRPLDDGANILASRWTDERTAARLERGACPPDRYVIGVALRPIRLNMGRGSETVFEGTMPTGMVYVTEPGQTIEAEFFTPCDFVHFHVAARYLRDRQMVSSAGSLGSNGHASPGERSLRNLVVRNELAAQLSRTLTEDLDGGDPL